MMRANLLFLLDCLICRDNHSIDIRKWLPGKHVYTIAICLPEVMAVGKYTLEIGIVGQDTPMIYLCTDAIRDGRYYQIGELMVEE